MNINSYTKLTVKTIDARYQLRSVSRQGKRLWEESGKMSDLAGCRDLGIKKIGERKKKERRRSRSGLCVK